MANFTASELVFGLFACLSIGIFVWGVRIRLRWIRSKYWPSTRGIITASSRRVNEDHRPNASSVTYGASVQYSYVAARQPFTGTRVTFGDYSASNPSHAAAILGRYPKGREVTVYYDPEDPSYSVLERNIGGNWILLTVGGLFAVILLYLLFRG